MDIINVVLAYTNEHYAKEPTQNLVAAFKLKVEFLVLNQLVDVTTQTRLAYLQEAAGRHSQKGFSGNSSIPSNARKQSSTMPTGSRKKDMTAFFEDRSSPLASANSTIFGHPVNPAPAIYSSKYSATSDSTSSYHASDVPKALSPHPSHHQQQQHHLNHPTPPFHSSPSIEALTLKHDPTPGQTVRSSRPRPESIWHRMWTALPTGSDAEDEEFEKDRSSKD